VILLDVNILLYSHNRDVAAHDRFSEWLQSALHEGGLLGIPSHCFMAFLRICTVPRGSAISLSLAEAKEVSQGWNESPIL